MARTRIKICGLTSRQDVAEAVAAGADAVGVVLAESPRQVSIAQAAEILADVPPFVARVGVFANSPDDLVDAVIERAGLTAVQFHGDETPAQCARMSVSVIKSFRVGTDFDIGGVEPFRGQTSAVLLDTFNSQALGGTGKAFSWQTIVELPRWAPLILAGGLDPTNVGSAIGILHPFAVDVSSGVEAEPGCKDADKMHAFVAAVRATDSGVTP